MSKPNKPRKESMSIKIEPQLRYLIDIASRVHRRSLTNYVEWALKESLKQVKINSEDSSLLDLTVQLWDVLESERVIKLAVLAPQLLSIEEQLIFKVITNNNLKFLRCEDSYNVFIKTTHYKLSTSGDGGKKVEKNLSLEDFNLSKINKYWDLITAASQCAEKERELLKELQDE